MTPKTIYQTVVVVAASCATVPVRAEDSELPSGIDISQIESMQRQRWLDVDREVELRRVDKIALEQAREYRTGEHARAPERGRDGRILLPFNGSPRVICAPKHVCDIELEEGEMIHNSALGNGSDEQGEWELTIAGTSTTPHLVVKPLVPNASTNLIVHGQTRVYNIELVSTASPRDDYMPFVAFKYPE
ncbi:MAG TPA: TrbG/VirB9 family P-type conjugative transfer protein, partial [Polyangiales bacterium]|nr:TrbG/VirB9 family P-type conjugative transfer protein [Polyangiales bacterium]